MPEQMVLPVSYAKCGESSRSRCQRSRKCRHACDWLNKEFKGYFYPEPVTCKYFEELVVGESVDLNR